jgi:hypothetical protein
VAPPTFDRSVFINCPFDEDYAPILQAILFCIVYLGLQPRLATERIDSGDVRIAKIQDLIENSKYSIHDLSRCQATAAGEHYRLNMPFELGIDYACRRYFGHGRDAKRILVLEEKPYRYQAALSDLAGCDISPHGGDFQKAIRAVRNWLVSEAHVPGVGAQKIINAYTTEFQEWYYERQRANGFSEEDILDYPTSELLAAMQEWVEWGKLI